MTYGVVMIVKDGGSKLKACLRSARRYCDTATIVDTGSTDGTLAYLRRQKWVTLHERPWVNFGHNRSEAFALARGTADWLLALDADMTVEIDPGVEPDPEVEAYTLRMGDENFSWRLPLLLRGDLAWRSIGAVHEYTALVEDRWYRSEPTDKVRVTYRDEHRDPAKTAWQLGMLEDPRTIFYAAQCHRELGQLEQAHHLYRVRAALGGYVEEAWYAAYQAALLEPRWEDQVVALMAAWEMLPTRLEPLFSLVEGLNKRGQHHAAYPLACVTTEMPDGLFVHKSVYDWGMKFQRSIAAWWVGRKDECRRLCDELLTMPNLPDHIRGQVETNRGFT